MHANELQSWLLLRTSWATSGKYLLSRSHSRNICVYFGNIPPFKALWVSLMVKQVWNQLERLR